MMRRARGRDPLALVALAALAVAVLLMVAFDEWFTRLPGVLALFAFIVAGVFAIARPEFLEEEERAGDPGPRRASRSGRSRRRS